MSKDKKTGYLAAALLLEKFDIDDETKKSLIMETFEKAEAMLDNKKTAKDSRN